DGRARLLLGALHERGLGHAVRCMPIRSSLNRLRRRARTERDFRSSRDGRADVAVFHEFHPPPYGGGNQFLIALVGELQRRGLEVETNTLSGETPGGLSNSFNFHFQAL